MVKTGDGSLVDCRIKGKFRLNDLKNTNPVAVGDNVILASEDGQNTAVITEILPRGNYISRQSPRFKHARHIIASNVDQAFLITTVAKPRTSTGFIDRFLVTAEAYHIETHIIFNKQDVLSFNELAKQEEIQGIYEKIGYNTQLVSAITGTGVEILTKQMKDKATLFAGHSGVGKSSLINAILPGLDLKTAEISRQHKKGTHSTTYAEMFDLPFGGYIIDTPGIKEFGVLDLEPEEVSHYYPEMKELVPDCKFNNCTHISEPNCAVLAALENGVIYKERYKNYLNIVEDCKTANKN